MTMISNTLEMARATGLLTIYKTLWLTVGSLSNKNSDLLYTTNSTLMRITYKVLALKDTKLLQLDLTSEL
jgi:hypothetical protein